MTKVALYCLVPITTSLYFNLVYQELAPHSQTWLQIASIAGTLFGIALVWKGYQIQSELNIPN